jgi:hypothetical protein
VSYDSFFQTGQKGFGTFICCSTFWRKTKSSFSDTQGHTYTYIPPFRKVRKTPEQAIPIHAFENIWLENILLIIPVTRHFFWPS